MTEHEDSELAELLADMEPEVYRLITDNDGHWYVIEQDQEANFYTWVSDMENDRESEYAFDDCAIGGSPTRVKFTSYWIE